jgi:hypothetical protein
MTTVRPNPITAHNAGRRVQFRFAGGVFRSGVCEFERYGVLCVHTNPEGWQKVAGGRNAVETPGRGWIGSCILEGCQSAATPPGSMRDLGRRSGGLAPLDPRLPSGKPPACFPADPKTNDVP